MIPHHPLDVFSRSSRGRPKSTSQGSPLDVRLGCPLDVRLGRHVDVISNVPRTSDWDVPGMMVK